MSTVAPSHCEIHSSRFPFGTATHSLYYRNHTETTTDWFAHQLEAVNGHEEHFVCSRTFSKYVLKPNRVVLFQISHTCVFVAVVTRCSPRITCVLCNETWSTAAVGLPGCSLSCTGPVRDKRLPSITKTTDFDNLAACFWIFKILSIPLRKNLHFHSLIRLF